MQNIMQLDIGALQYSSFVLRSSSAEVSSSSQCRLVVRMLTSGCICQAHEEAARQQQEAVRRAQLAEEERANYQAAMQNLQQRSQYLQQQEEQRLAEIARHRQQCLQEEQAHKAAQARQVPFGFLSAITQL